MKKRAKNIDEKMESYILEIINSCEDKISWPLVLEKIMRDKGEDYTEQGLRKHTRIADAYRIRKNFLRKCNLQSGVHRLKKDPTLRIRELESEVEILRTQNNKLIEKFIVWSHNAALHSISEAQLNEAIEVVSQLRRKS